MSAGVDILVVGAGPTGLALAAQAHDHGARVRIVERRADVFRPSRALIVHPRTLEVLRTLGVTDALLKLANTAPGVRLHLGARIVDVRLDQLAIPGTAFSHLTLVRQMDVERVLIDALARRGIAVEREVELVELCEGPDAVQVLLRSGNGIEESACGYVVGCDGSGSVVRQAAGIAWRGGPYAVEVVLADVEIDQDLDKDIAHAFIGRHGLLMLFALGERATWRMLVTRPVGGDPLPFGQPGPPVPEDDLRAMTGAAGVGARIEHLAWSARYPLQHRLADDFRHGRLFLTGDAAHAWSPATGQGMNAGIQDALNLGWKLAFAAAATDREALLASYDRERRPIARRLLALTHLAFRVEAGTGPIPAILRGVIAPVAAPLAPFLLARRRLVGEAERFMSLLRARYPSSSVAVEARPRLRTGPRAGHRIPDTYVIVDGDRVRLHDLLARPGVHVLLHRDAAAITQPDLGPLVSVHRMANVRGKGVVVVRPDGHVGFRCGRADIDQLRDWLSRIGALAASPGPPAPEMALADSGARTAT